MPSHDTPTEFSFGGQYPMRVCRLTCTVPAAATSVTVTSSSKFRGTIEKIQIKPTTLTASATIAGYETNSPLGTPGKFLNFTAANPAVEREFQPLMLATDAAGANLTGAYTKYAVNDTLTVAVASATAGDVVDVYIYVRG